MNGRSICPACRCKVLIVHVNGRLTILDYPHAVNGDYAVEQTVAGGWNARYAPVGERISPAERRYRLHSCEPPEPMEATVPPDQVQRWQEAAAAHQAALRRGRKPAAHVAGVRKAR